MTIILNVLIKSLVYTFYRANLGFFLVVLYLAFFLMRGQDHIALASSIATSLPLTLFTILLWAIYWAKAMGFVHTAINIKKNSFMRQYVLYNKRTQLWLLFIVFAIIGLPALAYASFISTFNFTYNTYGLFALMLSFLLAVNTIASFYIMYRLRKPIREPSLGLWYRIISENFPLPFSLWYLRHLFTKEALSTFLTKSGSLTLLLGTNYLFKTDVYDWRLIGVGTLFSFLFNSMLIYDYFEFTTKNTWLNNLPRPTLSISISTLTTTVILFIPEIVFILFHFPNSLPLIDLAGLLLFDASFGYFILNSLLYKPILKEEYGKRIFYLMIIMIFSILYGVPLLITSLICIALGFGMMSKYYYLLSNRL